MLLDRDIYEALQKHIHETHPAPDAERKRDEEYTLKKTKMHRLNDGLYVKL